MAARRSNVGISVNGLCEPGFEELRNTFTSHLESGKDENAQLCVYFDGKCVADLWGTSVGNTQYGPDLMHMIFSSGKSVMSIAIAMQVDRGLLSYSDKVSRHWPEFGQYGKEAITVADVMRHEAGLNVLHKPLPKTAALRPNLKDNVVGKVIEETKPDFPEVANPDGSKSRRGYHYVTRGFILNEVLRRVDPKGRTLGEFIREEFPSELDVCCGLEETEIVKLAPQREASPYWSIAQSAFGTRTCMTGKEAVRLTTSLLPLASKMRSRTPWFEGQVLSTRGSNYLFFSQDIMRMCEIPSASLHATARGLAKLAAFMADRGHPLMSEEAWLKMHAEPKCALDADLKYRTLFTQGGVNYFTLDNTIPVSAMEALDKGEREGYYGWFGYGGSVFQWHPELKIGFAYLPSLFQPMDMLNLRGARLQQVAVECVKNLLANRSS